MKAKLLFTLIFFISLFLNGQSGGAIYQTGPPMMRAKIFPVASVLNNGKIISFGGRENGFVSCAYADIYDPSTNTFSEIPMNFPHDYAAVAKLSDGRYFIAGGGQNYGVPAYATTEIYDNSTGIFSIKASMLAVRMMATAVQLTNDKVLIAGAWYNNTAASYGELYDPVTNTFTATGTLNQPRANQILLPTADGGAVMAGGIPTTGGATYTITEYYNPNTNVFESLNSEVIPTDPGWLLYSFSTAPIDDFRMSNGNYILLAHRSTPTLEYALIEFNPTSKSFSKLTTSQPLAGTLTNGGFYKLILNRTDNLAYALGLKANTNPYQICLVTVNLDTGQTSYPLTSYTMPTQEVIHAAMTYDGLNGKILLQGISSSTDNFSATNKTYLLTTQAELGINDFEQIPTSFYVSEKVLYFKNTQNLSEIKSIEVYNTIGQKVFKTSKITNEISFKNLPVGVLILKVANFNSNCQTLRFLSN